MEVWTKGVAGYDEEKKIVTSPKFDFKGHAQGMGHLMFQNIKKHFGKVSHIDADTGAQITFDELYEKTVRTAIHMQTLGIKPDDIVSVCCHNKIDCAAAFLAVTFIGAVNASLDPSLAASDIEHLLGQVTPKMIFVSEECEELIDNVVQKLGFETKIVVFGASKRNLEYESFLTPKKDEASFEAHQVTDLTKLCAILFSSGSTGLPKGICLSHNYLLYNTVTSLSVVMSIASLYWISATVALMSTVVHGSIKVITKTFDPKKAWDYIENYKIDMLQLPPYQAINFINTKPENLVSSLKALLLLGGPTTTEYILQMRAALPKTIVCLGFASTETCLIFNPLPPQSLKKPQSVGIPFPNNLAKIVDPETEQTLGVNQRGELRVKSNWYFSGYYNQDSSGVWDADGFFKTGDVAYYDEDYCFFIVDRIREMFKYKGFHITPVKLESILLNHPEIDLAVIVGYPHAIDEHHISAVVVLKEGSKLTPEEIEKYFNAQVDDRNQIRAGVRIFPSIPMTPTGKMNRMAVKKMVLNK